MPDQQLPHFDFGFRPENYWPNSLDVRVLSTVKGEMRLIAIRHQLAGGDKTVLLSSMAESSLPEDERRAAGRFHPSFMGGEYLPDFLPREVEIARISLRSVTADVLSLRARLARTRIHYRLVDEYDTHYEVAPRCSKQPLSLGELIDLLEGPDISMPRCFWSDQHLYGETLQRCVDFATVSSAFYPELEVYFECKANLWMEEREEEALQDLSLSDDDSRVASALEWDLWKTPWDYAEYHTGDLEPLDARLLTKWLRELTGDPNALVLEDDGRSNKSDSKCLLIRWREKTVKTIEVPHGENTSVLKAFTSFLGRTERLAEMEDKRNRYRDQRKRERQAEEDARSNAVNERKQRRLLGIAPDDLRYFVRTFDDIRRKEDWVESQGYPLQVVFCGDGGSYDGHIYRFHRREHAEHFIEKYQVPGRLYYVPE